MSRGVCARLAALLVLALLIGGCAQLQSFGGSRAQDGAEESFELLGRVYVRFGERAFSGSLRWRHVADADEVWLSGPLGQTAAHIVRDASGASLTTADQQTYRSYSLDALTREGLGWTLPLADLSFYILGTVPREAESGAERDGSARLVRAVRDGWEVRWVQRQEVTGSVTPGRLELRKGDVEIRLVVDRLDQDVR